MIITLKCENETLPRLATAETRATHRNTTVPSRFRPEKEERTDRKISSVTKKSVMALAMYTAQYG
jgi:hypothetical protein